MTCWIWKRTGITCANAAGRLPRAIFRRLPAGDDHSSVSWRASLAIAVVIPRVLVALSPQFARNGQGTFLGWLVLYAVTTTAYSLRLKRMVLVDVIVLSGLYTIRILAGSAASGVPVSQWLAAFSIFFFLSLAFVKRFSELEGVRQRSEASGTIALKGRGYQPLRPGTDAQLRHGQRICIGDRVRAVHRKRSGAEPVSALTRVCGCWFRCCCSGSAGCGCWPRAASCTRTPWYTRSRTSAACCWGRWWWRLCCRRCEARYTG